MTQISSVPGTSRAVCCDVRWIQRRLPANPSTPRHLNSPPCLHLPSTLCEQRPTGLASLMPSFFPLPLILLLLHPALSLSSHRSSDHHLPRASPSLPLCVRLSIQGKKTSTSSRLNSDFLHCVCVYSVFTAGMRL